MIKRDLTGLKFGSIKVIGFETYNKNGRPLWKVQCECGKEYIVTYSGAVYANKCRKCGGLKRRTNNVLSSRVWGNIKYWAKYRNIEIAQNVTRKSLWELYIKQNKKCAYSGLDIFMTDSDSNSHWSENTASLDRINSSVGYVDGNVQWVHKVINSMKMDINQDRFLELCKFVAKNNP
jgi:hypothetical protein